MPVTDDLWRCSFCRAERVFTQPECAEGHDGDCPEWACTECGTAFVVSPALTGSRELVGAGVRTA